METTTGPKSGENSWLWLLKLVTGLLIIVVLLVHFIVNHFIAEGGLLTYEQVVVYYQNPLIPAMEISFLIFVVSHSLLGLRSIVLDLNPSRSTIAVVNWVLSGIGIVSVGYGIWLAMSIISQGR